MGLTTRNITRSFLWTEFELSATAKAHKIDNRVPDAVKPYVQEFCRTVLQPLRDKVGKPITVSSGYRCKKLNELVGGSATSQHVTGEAADIKIATMRPLDVAQKIYDMKLPFDQPIVYPTWVHVSHRMFGIQRRQVLYNKSYTGEHLKR